MRRGRFRPEQVIAIGNNQPRTRSHNRRVVLEAVRLHGPLGRAEIGRLTHLTAQAVSNIVSELVEEGLLVERGRLRRGRGQPPVQFMVNPDGGMTAGIEIAAGQMVTVLVDLSGRPLAERAIPVSDAGPERVARLLVGEIAAARRATPAAPDRLIGVGVVMPGPFGVEGMTSVGPTTLPGWSGIDAAALLRTAIGVPVTVENDATAAAVGERLYGVGRRLRNFCHVYFGAGLGLGVMIDGQPFRGGFGNAGEIGHVVLTPGDRPCACGNVGCLECYASLYALQEQLAAAGVTAPDADALESLHAAGHPVVKAWIGEAAGRLAPMVAMLENLFDPEAVIFGGALPDSLIDALIAAMTPLPRSVAIRRQRALPRVVRGATGHLTAALGAAALPVLEAVTPRLDVVATPGDRRMQSSIGVEADAHRS